jgi:hypothetical protein
MSKLELLLGGDSFQVQGLAGRLTWAGLAQGSRAERIEVQLAVSEEIF